MTDRATERITIEATPERCFEVALDFERYPEWAADIKEVKVLDRDEQGRGVRVSYRAAGMGRSLHYTLAYEYGVDPTSMRWVLDEGDIMRQLDGEYRFEPAGDGTEVTYELVVELVIPLLGFMKRRAENKIMGTALRELKRQVES
jgi:ribosome-associated toxin RatA of RatAB toxin-antitoxin module